MTKKCVLCDEEMSEDDNHYLDYYMTDSLSIL